MSDTFTDMGCPLIYAGLRYYADGICNQQLNYEECGMYIRHISVLLIVCIPYRFDYLDT